MHLQYGDAVDIGEDCWGEIPAVTESKDQACGMRWSSASVYIATTADIE
jgi:hypothetical protein